MLFGTFAPRALIATGLRSPGQLYNIGNAIAFATGLIVAVASRPASGGAGFWSAGADYLMGSRSAALMTVAMIVFFASGEFYARAFRRGGASSDARNQIRIADLLSGLGAILLAAALACVGNLVLAALSGLLSAGGKLGSACLGGLTTVPGARKTGLIAACRVAALLSRLPAAVAAIDGLLSAGGRGDLSGAVLAAVMLGCYALWAAADALLIAAENASIRSGASTPGPEASEGWKRKQASAAL